VKLDPAAERAARAALSKKAEEVVVLDLRRVADFADFFVLACASNQRQLVAAADAVSLSLREAGLRPSHVEGYPRHEWILLDYGFLVVHLFTPRMRRYYDLERLWGEAARVEIAG
jgi:ribosome-associated protein